MKRKQDFGFQREQSDRLKKALEGGSKTATKTGNGIPDFNVEIYGQDDTHRPHGVPVLIEDKLGTNRLSASSGKELKMDSRSVSNYALNGAVAYAQSVIASNLYDEAIAVGIAGDDEDHIEIKVAYVYSQGLQPKILDNVTTLHFLESHESFNKFMLDAALTEVEKHKILVESRATIQKNAKSLNKLLNNSSVNIEQRVVYLAGCLLAAQDVIDENGNKLKAGLTPDDLKGLTYAGFRDGEIIVNHINSFFTFKNINHERMDMLLSTYRNSISVDADRDIPRAVDKEAKKILLDEASLNKQIFTFIWHYIYQAIDATGGHLDIMGEMYSEFLKYAFGDGKDIGIVLTPPYVTSLMVDILGVTKDSRVMDLATGSAGFLIAALTHMTEEVNKEYGRDTNAAKAKIREIQANQLLGVELDAKMFALATANMLIRGDNGNVIAKGSTFDYPPHLYDEFDADILLLNPPFSYTENGMPFLEHGLNHMRKGGRAAIIVQDSAGSGRAIKTNRRILKENTLLASIKMPMDLFQPNAGVQTSIYVFEAGRPHNFERDYVRFIDFRNDGYKRTGRGLSEVDNPEQRYQDLRNIYEGGKDAEVEAEWDLQSMVLDAKITDSGDDWNFEKHQKIDIIPVEDDFMEIVGDYLSWAIVEQIKGRLV